MTMRIGRFIAVILVLTSLSDVTLAQKLRGDPTFRKVGIHNGNLVKTVFGNWGVIAQPADQGPPLAWKFDDNGYAGDVSILVGVELDFPRLGISNDTVHSVVICPVDRPGGASGGESGSGGKFWGFEPVPGYANPTLEAPGKGVAMSHLPETWPPFWPDHPDWVDSTGKAVWNGYFGKGITNADQESYFVMDDNADEKYNLRYGFRPDSTDSTRMGLGLVVKVRGLQWSNVLAEDGIFWIYDITNDGTTDYRKTVFGFLVGTWVGAGGGSSGNTEWRDDLSFFDPSEDLTYSWDADDYIDRSSNPKWVGDVGYLGYGFLETPGNPFDGIDNDGDSRDPSSPRFKAEDFPPSDLNPAGVRRILSPVDPGPNPNFPNNKIVVINVKKRYSEIYGVYQTFYERKVISLDTLFSGSDTVEVISLGVKYRIWPGKELIEIPNNGLDDDLDGLIDESFDLHYKQIRKTARGEIIFELLNPLAYKNYFTGAGLDDPMIDERRDDGIDNDGDWDPEWDDVGADGVPGTGDEGEGDGIPTPGEPHFDAVDVNESDQIGLTSFDFFVPAGAINMANDEELWLRLAPGNWQVPEQFIAGYVEGPDFDAGSGYFPLTSKQTERFSLVLFFGEDLKDLYNNKRVMQGIYDANYNFPRPPEKPRLTAVPGDKKVILYWDDVAERSFDRALAEVYRNKGEDVSKAYDFEGYKLYRATDPNFNDARVVTDGFGNPIFYKPIAQFDLKDSVFGWFPIDVNGVKFWLGEDTGIQHQYIDRDVRNGVTYYYALVAYDKGDADIGVIPSENTKFIQRTVTGELIFDINTVQVTPNAPPAGFVPAGTDTIMHKLGPATGEIYLYVLDPTKVKDNHTYRVVFKDKGFSRVTESYSVIDVTDPDNPDTLVKWSTKLEGETELFDGMRLIFDNHWDIKYIDSLSGWNRPGNPDFAAFVFSAGLIKGKPYPADYAIEFYDEIVDTSSSYPGIRIPVSPVNFRVKNLTDDRYVDFIYVNVYNPNIQLRQITIGIIEESKGERSLTWAVIFKGDSSLSLPGGGNVLTVRTTKPFREGDVYEFTVRANRIDRELAKSELDKIKVVPNPYVVAERWEPPLPPGISSGRGPQKIQFTHVPPGAKIYIFTSRGELVVTLEQDDNVMDGSVVWNLKTKENLDAAYGVYFYVVDAPGIGRKTGKFAIIK
jgi:hypothetical protein